MNKKQEAGSVVGLRVLDGVERALLCVILSGGVALGAVAAKPAWEAESAQTRPWVYNWWMGSAVTEAGLEAQARALAEGGFGGFHVIPIYGVKGITRRTNHATSPLNGAQSGRRRSARRSPFRPRPLLSDCGGRGKGLEYAPNKEKCCHGQESGAEY